MIRFVLGLFIIMGAVGADDFALEAGTQPPALLQTIFLCTIGIGLMLWAMPKLARQNG
jgi:hypothetical protein